MAVQRAGKAYKKGESISSHTEFTAEKERWESCYNDEIFKVN